MSDPILSLETITKTSDSFEEKYNAVIATLKDVVNELNSLTEVKDLAYFGHNYSVNVITPPNSNDTGELFRVKLYNSNSFKGILHYDGEDGKITSSYCSIESLKDAIKELNTNVVFSRKIINGINNGRKRAKCSLEDDSYY